MVSPVLWGFSEDQSFVGAFSGLVSNCSETDEVEESFQGSLLYLKSFFRKPNQEESKKEKKKRKRETDDKEELYFGKHASKITI